jgi:hypothetical protein
MLDQVLIQGFFFLAVVQYVYTEMSNLVGLVTRKDLIKVTKQMVYAPLLHFFSHILTYTLFFWATTLFWHT